MRGQLILASKSPRRIELLEREGYRFEVAPSSQDELSSALFEATDLVQKNAQLKAEDILEKRGKSNEVVLGADTVVVLDEQILEKPRDLQEGAEMLKALSGRSHFVYTGVCVVNVERSTIFSERSEVVFKSLSPQIIKTYQEKVEVLDKSGGYGIQSYGEMIIDQIIGEFENVMGLPIESTKRVLASFGIDGKGGATV